MKCKIIDHLAGTIELETLALDTEEAVEAEISLGGLPLESIKIGIEGLICSRNSLLLSSTTTSDIAGLIAADG